MCKVRRTWFPAGNGWTRRVALYGVLAAMSHRARAVNGLHVVPMTHAGANVYVERVHRHNGKLPTSIFRVGVADGDGLVRGVAIAGLPKARLLCDGYTVEVNRVCTDGAYNACSMLYAACVQAARALGYRRLITYTMEREAGASLRASGWTQVASLDPRDWGQERHEGRRTDKHEPGARHRWQITLAGPVLALRWPEIVTDEDQIDLFGTEVSAQ